MANRPFLKDQDMPTGPCPTCETGSIYTGRAAALNVKIDDQAVCEDCKVKSLIAKYWSDNKRG